jgi:hypothetical protein
MIKISGYLIKTGVRPAISTCVGMQLDLPLFYTGHIDWIQDIESDCYFSNFLEKSLIIILLK